MKSRSRGGRKKEEKRERERERECGREKEEKGDGATPVLLHLSELLLPTSSAVQSQQVLSPTFCTREPLAAAPVDSLPFHSLVLSLFARGQFLSLFFFVCPIDDDACRINARKVYTHPTTEDTEYSTYRPTVKA